MNFSNHMNFLPSKTMVAFNETGRANTILRKMIQLSAITLLFTMSGCKDYSVTINNNRVYTPPSIFKDFNIPDEHLRDCVEQTIFDKHVTQVTELTQLNCSNAGIKNLAGLEKFYNLQKLNLPENNIESLAPLTQLAHMQILNLNKNKIKDTSPLLHMTELKSLDLSENPDASCGDLAQLKQNYAKTPFNLVLPEQCQGH